MPPPGATIVLVAEDEPALREMLARGLREEGYVVLTAPDGVRALALLQSSPDPIDLLVADLDMPRLRGDQLAIEAEHRGLTRHVLFLTGGDEHPEAAQRLGHVLVKPFDPGELSKAVAAILGGGGAPPP